MKNILVPTDYSETAKNATQYAIEFAKNIGGKITLLHVFDIPISVTDAPIVVASFEEIEESQKKHLQKHVADLKEEHGDSISIDSVLSPGFLSDEIEEVIEMKNIDLIIMGITGGNRAEELLIGSNVTRVINHVNCPVIAVHANTKYSPVKKMAFACDYEDIEESTGINKLIDFVKLFDAKLHLINITDKDEKPTYKKDLNAALLEHVFDKVNHTVSFRKNDDVVDGVNKFVDNNHIDMVVVLPKKHTIFSRLFHESNTKKLAFHTRVPLLAIHNN